VFPEMMARMITTGRLDDMAARLARVPGVCAVTLGGSRARGTHTADSGVDLGVYYRRDELDLDALGELARDVTGEKTDVAGPGGWGPWVDGGAWLTVEGSAVDWILRDVDRVAEQCARAVRGEFAFHPQPGHPLGFLDVAYAGEVATAVVLADPAGTLDRLRAEVDPYPPALARAMVENLWQARFLTDAAAKGARRGDTAYVGLCAGTALLLCAHAWHAVAGVWVTNEKGLVPHVARLGLDTGGFAEEATSLMAALGGEPADLRESVSELARLVDSCCVATAGGAGSAR